MNTFGVLSAQWSVARPSHSKVETGSIAARAPNYLCFRGSDSNAAVSLLDFLT